MGSKRNRKVKDSHAGDASAGDLVVLDVRIAILEVGAILLPHAPSSILVLVEAIVDASNLDLSSAHSEAQQKQKHGGSLHLAVFDRLPLHSTFLRTVYLRFEFSCWCFCHFYG